MEMMNRPYLDCNKEEIEVLKNFYSTLKNYCDKVDSCTECPFYEICEGDDDNDYLGYDVNVPQIIAVILKQLKIMEKEVYKWKNS